MESLDAGRDRFSTPVSKSVTTMKVIGSSPEPWSALVASFFTCPCCKRIFIQLSLPDCSYVHGAWEETNPQLCPCLSYHPRWLWVSSSF